MADESDRTGSWWKTLPGVLTAIAALLTAATGLVAILSQTGVLGEKSKTFVAQKAGDVRDAVAAPAKVEPVSAPASAPPPAPKDDPATGIAGTPLHATKFTGAVVTLLDGSVVKLRDDIREYCLGRPQLRALSGQTIEMERMRRFDLSDWNANKGSAHITLNNGETLDVKIEGCSMIGTNDLGNYQGPFAKIRSVEFIR